MSVIAISETAGSLGTEIARSVAARLGYELADREIITKAADRFGEAATEIVHATEEKPTLWDRFRDTQRRYMTYVEAIVLELAAADRVVLVGRGSAIVLARFPNVLRVRVTAPEGTRARRVEGGQGLTADAALDYVQRSDRELGARLRFFYHVDWDDSLRYDLVVNTDRLDVAAAVHTIEQLLGDERFQTSPEVGRAILDASLTAQAKAVLLRNPVTRPRQIVVSCRDANLSLTGSVEVPSEREAAEAEVARIPGVKHVGNEIVVLGAVRRGAGAA
ncbi:MAG: cytidylate kinase family protein [Candidatus Rokubacteria bacterium]|nr:cytidylate kinase family protein [Candidatus Rokubacteria bacterium]